LCNRQNEEALPRGSAPSGELLAYAEEVLENKKRDSLLSLKIGAKKGKSIPSEQDTLACNIVLSKRQDLP
jgi:hypothetical protein